MPMRGPGGEGLANRRHHKIGPEKRHAWGEPLKAAQGRAGGPSRWAGPELGLADIDASIPDPVLLWFTSLEHVLERLAARAA